MALTKRIIACLDVKNGRTVKGTNFIDLKDMGDPVELADYYSKQGIDELVFLDISASDEKRRTLASLVCKIAGTINIPFTVGGGINKIGDVKILLENGADKISINTAAVNNPKLIGDLAKEFGSQCIVLAVDTKFVSLSSGGGVPAEAWGRERFGDWMIYINGGKVATKLKTRDWVRQAESLGAGEILLTSIDHDGTRNGFALSLIRLASGLVNIPVIASGGAGKMEDFEQVFTEGKADAALAAGIFHERSVDIPTLKQFLKSKNIPVRI